MNFFQQLATWQHQQREADLLMANLLTLLGTSGGGFSPSQIAGLALWLRADLGVYQDTGLTTPAVADGDPVGGWQDQSGTGNHALQATAGKRPLLKLAIQNGQPVLRFDATNDFLQATLVSTLTQPYTGFLVCKTTNVGRGDAFYDGPAAVNNLVDSDGLHYRLISGGSITGPAMDTAFHVCTTLWNGAASALRIDGAETDGNPGAPNLSKLTLGIRGDLSSNPLGGDIGEVLFYTGALSAGNMALVEAYLKARWGTP
jgi:hypothetical protein